MPMEREAHEAILNELLTPDLDQSRRTELLQNLRTQHATDLGDFETLTTNNKKLTLDNADLVVSNSKLFRMQGIVGTDGEDKAKDKEFSETVTIEDLERSAT